MPEFSEESGVFPPGELLWDLLSYVVEPKLAKR